MTGATVVPVDIIMHEIVIRLPFKSVIRCRCVCKLWNSLLYNPDYLSLLNRSVSQTHTADCLIFMYDYYNNNRRYTTSSSDVSILSATCNKLQETRMNNNNVPYPSSLSKDEIHLIGSVNGLVCMAFYLKRKYQFILWNPTIRYSKKILVHKNLGFQIYPPLLYGFGWDSVTNDYKLMVKSLTRVSPAGVYSCKTNSWSEINNDLSIVDTADSKSPCVIVDGSPYWSNWKNSNTILKFDIVSNEFRSLDVPAGWFYYNLVNLNDCLGLIDYGSWFSAEVVYRFDEARNEWTKMYTIDKCVNHLSTRLYCFKYGGEIVFHGEKQQLYLFDPKSNKFKCCCGDCCLVKSRKRKRRCFHDCGGCLINGFSYTPTLVALQGMKALHQL